MLSRTAANLFWIARYMERVETMARLLEVGYRISLMPSAGQGHRNEWESILAAAGDLEAYQDRYKDVKQVNIENFLFFNLDNPSSVASCIAQARDNARIVRTALTREVWDALNGAFQEMKELTTHRRSRSDLPSLCDWAKKQSALVRGAIESTQLQQDGYDFLNLGYYIERADNTARLMDMKYHVLLPSTDMVGGSLDNFQWTTLLRSLSAFRSFHWAYGGDYHQSKIAHFLILNVANPRSLLHCVDNYNYHLNRLARAYGQSTPAQKDSRNLMSRLSEESIDDIIQDGLHEFLTDFIAENGRIGVSVADSYLFGGG